MWGNLHKKHDILIFYNSFEVKHHVIVILLN